MITHTLIIKPILPFGGARVFQKSICNRGHHTFFTSSSSNLQINKNRHWKQLQQQRRGISSIITTKAEKLKQKAEKTKQKAEKTNKNTKDKAENTSSIINNINNNDIVQAGEKRIINEFGVEMLPDWLYNQIFRREARPKMSEERLQLAKDHLSKQGLADKEADALSPLQEFKLPNLCGSTIAEHFLKIGEKQTRPVRELAIRFAESVLPDVPKNWEFKAGWTRYTGDGKEPESVEYPDEELLCFDVETLLSDSPFALMAVAASPDAWYGWVSPQLTEYADNKKKESIKKLSNPDDSVNSIRKGRLIPIGKLQKNRIVVGHNVGFDRARIKEEYHLDPTNTYFLDTMALHVAVSGLCSQQRPSWIKYDKAAAANDSIYLEQAQDFQAVYDVSSLNNLRDVYKFHCSEILDKSARDMFVSGTMEEISDLENFPTLMNYCATDVLATHRVFKKVLPRFLQTCPHPVSFAGMVHMGNMFLPVSCDWDDYLKSAEGVFQEQTSSIEKNLCELAWAAVKLKPEEAMKDPWLQQLDWSLPSLRSRKLPDKPNWYRNLYNARTGKIKITVRTLIAPLLLKLKWLNYPLYFSQKYGWMYRVPKEDTQYQTKAKQCTFQTNPEEPDYEERFAQDEGARYYKVPHKDGEAARVVNPMAKNFVSAFENGILSSEYPEARNALGMNAACSYWISARERIQSQMVVYQGHPDIKDIGFEMDDGKLPGMILPQTLTMGTVTRRAVEKTWLTASNAKENRIGSELKAMVQSPKGYKIVGADVDSEELWISSLIGDAQFGAHGSTALGWMTLQGTKKAGTDLHSKTASILGISRDSAKVFNYGRIYGAGLKFAIQMLRQFNENIEEADAQQRAESLYKQTKGEKYYVNKEAKTLWYGGTESYMFNGLERIATNVEPKTPVLKCGITDALNSKVVNRNYMTSRVNWVVQSSGVDYLHLLLVSMKYLTEKYGIWTRFLLSVHDEVRFLVKEEDSYRAALALQISNLWTRAIFSYMLGIEDLPSSIAFFSAVDIDHVLRKEVEMNCKTLSHPSEIPQGVNITIQNLLKKQKTLYREDNEPDNYNNEDLSTYEISKMPSLYAKLLVQQQPSKDEVFLKAQSCMSSSEIDQEYKKPRYTDNSESKKGYGNYSNEQMNLESSSYYNNYNQEQRNLESSSYYNNMSYNNILYNNEISYNHDNNLSNQIHASQEDNEQYGLHENQTESASIDWGYTQESNQQLHQRYNHNNSSQQPACERHNNYMVSTDNNSNSNINMYRKILRQPKFSIATKKTMSNKNTNNYNSQKSNLIYPQNNITSSRSIINQDDSPSSLDVLHITSTCKYKRITGKRLAKVTGTGELAQLKPLSASKPKKFLGKNLNFQYSE
ncbi:1009_t:CDS:2 [Ambispora gerdemannii]|uniref:DNA-directed DNA polymerase n=1 Tax=Ambispora gerdemannii TaxID=144530 RepID=A0A9N8VU48_9GLOM|nr:1009_t:CDS:2 [Ambispora gerdemannii]